MLDSFFNEVSGLTAILKNICQRLLLHCTRTTQLRIRFTFTSFLIITTTTANISDVFFFVQIKKVSRIRSSHQRCFMIKVVLGNFAKLTAKYLCQSPFFNKVAGLRPATLLRKRLWHRFFTVTFAKF